MNVTVSQVRPTVESSPTRADLVRAVRGVDDDDVLAIAGERFTSRLFLGTGKYPDATSMMAALDASGAAMVPVAIDAGIGAASGAALAMERIE